MTGATTRLPERETALASALAVAGVAPRRVDHGVFAFGPPGIGDWGQATLDDEWVRLSLADATGASAWTDADLLEQNASLQGPAKWARQPTGKRTALVADCWFATGRTRDVAGIREGCESLGRAARRIAGRAGRDDDDAELPDGRDLAADLGADGWKAARRADGALTVDLDTDREYFQARIDGRAGGGRTWLRMQADVVTTQRGSADPEVDAALLLLLLGAGDTLRLARAAASAGDGRRAYRFEVSLAADASLGALDRALIALSVACATYGLEARALARPAIARVYTAVRGGSRPVQEMSRARLGVAGQGG